MVNNNLLLVAIEQEAGKHEKLVFILQKLTKKQEVKEQILKNYKKMFNFIKKNDYKYSVCIVEEYKDDEYQSKLRSFVKDSS